MATTEATRPTREPAEHRPAWVLPAIVLAAVVAGLVWFGRPDDATARWVRGEASVTGTQATVETEGWTYGLTGAVPQWTASDGSQHLDGWPECLADGVHRDVRVAWVPYDVDGTHGRTVVAVDCQAA